MSVYLDRAARCRALLNDPDADVIVRTVAGRLLRANVARAETILPVGVPTIRLEGSAGLRPNTGKAARHAAAPEPMEGSRHSVKRGRTKRGPTAIVTAYGLAHVVGSWEHDADGGLTPERASLAAEMFAGVGRMKPGAQGTSALDIYRLTQVMFGDEIPALLSTDNQAHHAVVHGDDSDTDDYGVAWHNPADPYAAMDMQGRTVPDSPITYRTRGYGLTYGLPDECVTDRWKVAAWLSGLRDSQSSIAGREMARRVRVGPESSIHWKDRNVLPVKHGRRAGDPTDRTETLANGYCFVAREHLTAPSADSEHVWVGHTLVARPEPRNGTSARGKRTRQTVKRRTVEHVTVSTVPELLARFATVAPGERITWKVGTRSGSFTRSADGRMSVGTPDGALVRSVRTTDAVERKLTTYCAA